MIHSENTLLSPPQNITGLISREEGNQLAGSGHRIIILTVQGVKLTAGPTITRWNYGWGGGGANWEVYRH